MAKKRGRPTKAEQAKKRGGDLLPELDQFTGIDISSSESEHYHPREQRKKSRKHKRTPKQPFVEDVEDEDGYPSPAPTPKSKPLKPTNTIKPRRKIRRSAQAEQFLDDLHTISTNLSSSQIEAEICLEDYGFIAEDTQKLKDQCEAIIKALSGKISESESNNEIPSTIDLYAQYFCLRAPSGIFYTLQPAEVHQGSINYNRRKVVGFIQKKGVNIPLMFALPGWTRAALPHPRLLDSAEWQEYVKYWAETVNHEFKKYRWDARHNKEPGDTYASHVECKLMLWFCMHMVEEKFPEFRGDLPAQLRSIWRLKDLPERLEAEIHLTELPCGPCLHFQQVIEQFTDVKFSIVIMKNLGILKPKKNKQGNKDYSLYASESESDIEELDTPSRSPRRQEESSRRQSNVEVQVVVRSKPATSSIESTVQIKTTRQEQTRKIRKYAHAHPSPKKVDWNSDIWEEEFRAPANYQRAVAPIRTLSRETPVKSHHVPPTPPTILFSAANYERAEKIKMKYKQDLGIDETTHKTKAARHRR